MVRISFFSTSNILMPLFARHTRVLTSFAGVTSENVQAVLNSEVRTATPSLPPNLAAVLRFTDAMTLDVRVPDDVFAELKKHFSEREVVEITATVGAYNCVSRVLVALDVGERNAMSGPSVGGVE
jgi:alkylhydroperoxidase family enzyme